MKTKVKPAKVIFVGLHNKPDKMPLCGSTKSGKLINRVVKEFDLPYQKTNMWDVDYYPTGNHEALSLEWYHRVEYSLSTDIIVLLGAKVHEKFIDMGFDHVLKFAHPSSKRSHKDMDEYVAKMVAAIKSKLEI